MSSVLAPRPNDRPPQGEDWGAGVAISVIAHLTLIGALVWGLHWRSRTEAATASAELWAAVPEAVAPPPVQAPPPPPVAAPPAPEPAPPPVEAPKPPDIVTEKIPDKKPPKPAPKPAPPPPAPKPPAKVEAPKPTPAPPPPKDKLDAKTLEKMREENLKRMMGQMGAPADATGTSTRNAAPSAGYMGRIVARLKPNVTLTESVSGNPGVEVEIHCAPDGTIIGRRITKSSGSPVWDNAVIRAIDKTSVLPRDTDGRIPSVIVLGWHPDD